MATKWQRVKRKIDKSPERSIIGKYPEKPKIIANPRKEKTTDPLMRTRGIKIIEYVYAFGIIGYRFELIENGSIPFYLIVQHKYNKEYGFPKGHYDKNKENNDGYDTAKREFEEETGLLFNNHNIISVDWYTPYISHYEFRRKDRLIKKWTVLFAAELSLNANPSIIRPKEICDIQFMSFIQFDKKCIHKEYKNILHELEAKLIQQTQNNNDEKKTEDIDCNNKKSTKTSKELKKMSITLSWILQHGIYDNKDINLCITNDGWVDVERLLNTKQMITHHSTFNDLVEIVQYNTNSRYSMQKEECQDIRFPNGKWRIRINKQHDMQSIESDKVLTKLKVEDLKDSGNICYGGYYNTYHVMIETGLSKMDRKYIHFVVDNDLINSNCDILIYVDVEQCINDGIIFYKSTNNVILTEGDDKGYIASKYFIKVVQFKNEKPDKTIYTRKD